MAKKDYLAKYKGKVSKPKKSSNVVIESDTSLAIDHEEGVKLNSNFKGFKRIDGGESSREHNEDKQHNEDKESDKQHNPSETPQEKPKTVFRDLSGRIVDPNTLSKPKPTTKEPFLIKEPSPQPQSPPKSFTISKSDSEYNNILKSKHLLEDPFSNQSIQSRHLEYTKGISPQNRFNIKAGVLWDGIDRSNGFEVKIVRKRNETKVEKHNFDDAYDFDYE